MRRPFRAVLAALSALVWLCLASAPPAAAQGRGQPSPFDAAITVDDTPITWYDIDQRMRLLRFNGAPADANLQAVATQQLIEDRLKRAAGERMGIRAPAGSEADLIAQFASLNQKDPATIDRGLARAGTTRAALIDALEADAIWRDVVRRRFGSRAEPTEIEIDQAIQLAAAGRNREFRLLELVIPTAQRGEAGTRAFAQQLSDQLNRGGDFGAAVRRHSASASVRNGGEIGWIAEGSLPGPVVSAIEDAGPGGVTAPIPLSGAVALLKLLETRNIRIEGAGTVSVAVMALSVQDRDPIAAVARLDALLAQNPTCETAEAMAQGAGVTARRGEARPIAALPEQVRNAVADLPQGGISAPVPVQGGAAAFLVCERNEGLSPEERERVRARLRQERFVRFSNAFLQELRADAVIEQR